MYQETIGKMAQAFFEVFITTVKKEHGLVKMYGQPDPQTGEVVRKYLAAVVPQLEGGSPPTADKVNIKQSVIARYDGGWYRAQVLGISGQKYTMYFVDYGNVNDVTLADIRIGLHSQLNQISPQVYPFYLADVVPPARDWSKPSMEFIEDALVNVLCRCIVVRRVKGYCFIRIFKPDSSDPFINDLVHCGMAVLGNPNMDLVPSLEQRQLAPMTSRPPLGYPPMLPPGSMGPPSPNFPTSLSPQPPMFPTQRASPQPHHSFPPPGLPPIQPVLPTHHASHPRLQSLNSSLPRALMHGQHLNDLSGIRMNRDSHNRQQHSRINHLPVQPLGRGSLVGNRVPGPHVDRGVRFRPMQLEEDKWHEVVLSSWDGGPTDFCIQLKSSSKHLRDLMDTISQRDQLIPMNLHQIDGGKPCLAMSKADNIIYRAAVLKRDKHLAKVYFLDYGITENLPLELIYNISDVHIKPRILSVRCCLSQWPDLSFNNKALAKSRFEQYADRQLGCKIVTSESERQGSTILTKTEVQLFDEAGNDIGAEIKLLLSLRPQEGGDVLSIAPTFRDNLSVPPTFRDNLSVSLSYSFAELPRKADVYLSFPGTGPSMFFVQVSDCTERLDPLMEEIATLMRGGPRVISSPAPGMPCAAKFSDGVWYRAQVEDVLHQQSKVQVYFVDYGNSEVVNYNAVSSIPDRLVSQLPAQAVRCKLVGPCEERDAVSPAVLEAFENLLNPDSPFSVNVEKKIQNVHYLQVRTITKPVLNVNQEIAKKMRDPTTSKHTMSHCQVPEASLSSGPEEIYITYFLSSNNFYGQLTSKRNQQQVQDFLDKLSEQCSRHGEMLYSAADSHVGEVCAVPDMSQGSVPSYYRAKIVKENKDNVDVAYLDVGGFAKIAKRSVYKPPPQMAKVPEFGIRCSLDITVPITDNKLKNLMFNSVVEVKKVGRLDEQYFKVDLPNNKSGKLKNSQILKCIAQNFDENGRPNPARSASPHSSQNEDWVNDNLNNLLEKQNRKQNQAIEKNGWNPPPERDNFKRGDLRISLREKRAEREASAPAANPIVSFRYQNIKEGWRGKGKITWVIDPSYFYIQLGNMTRFDDIMENIQKQMRSYQSNADMRAWGKGSPVLAKWNGEWYRGKVNFQKGNVVDVLFVDYGNIDKVPFSDVAPLPEEFSELEVQAVKVGLAGVKPVDGNWDNFPSDSHYFDENLLDVEVMKSVGRELLVKINNGSVGQMLIKDGLAWEDGKGEGERVRKTDRREESNAKGSGKKESGRKEEGFGKGGGRREEGWGKGEKRGENRRQTERGTKTFSEPPEVRDLVSQDKWESQSDKKHKEEPNIFKVGGFSMSEVNPMMGQVTKGIVSHFNSSSEFWVQFDEAKVNVIASRLENPNMVTVAPSLGLEVVAQWDGAWYRGIVKGLEEGGVKVHFVDYGNTELIKKEEIVECGKELLDFPLTAVRCKLIKKKDNFWDILENLNYLIKVRIKSFSAGQFVLQLIDREEKEGKRKGVAEQREKETKFVSFPPGEDVAVRVYHCENVDKVWVVPVSLQDDLEQLMTKLASYGDGLQPVTNVKVGTLVATRYTEDGEMYRAKVVSVNEETCEVQYVDYGNGEEVKTEDMFVLPDALAEFSPAARTIKIASTRFAMDCLENRDALFEALSPEDVKVRLKNLMGTFSVAGQELDVVNILKAREGNLFKLACIPQVVCSVPYLETGGGVWLIASQTLQKLEDMMENLQSSAGHSKAPSDVKVGMWVACKFSQDQSFYRAQVTKIHPEDKLDVHYIDYGNLELVSQADVRELGEEFSLHPGYAMRVEVDSAGDSKVLGQAEMFKVVTERQMVTAELVQPRQSVVRLYLDGQRVSYQPGTQAVETGLTPARLRLGAERMGMVVENVNHVMAVQDLEAAAKVEDALDAVENELEEVEGIPEVGKVYVEKEGMRRLVFTEVKENIATGCLVDSQERVELTLPAQLLVCSEKEKCLAPAAVSTAPLVTSTRDRFPLPGRLVGLSVEDNSLKIRENRFRLSVDFSPRAELSVTFTGSISARLSLVLPLLPASGSSWTPEVLATIRDYILGNKLNVYFNKNNVARIAAVGPQTDLVEKLIDSEVAKPNTELMEDKPSDEDCCVHEILLGADQKDEMIDDVHQLVSDESNKILVAVNDQLPKLHLTPGKQQVTVVKLEGDSAWIRPESDDLDRMWSDLIDQLSQVAPGGLSLSTALAPGATCLYTGEDDICLRALVVFNKEDSVGLALVDQGATVLCGVDEVVDLPSQLASFPPMTVLAGIEKTDSLKLEDGDIKDGILAVKDGQLVFSIAA